MPDQNAEIPFEVVGYIEEIWDADRRVCIGTRKVGASYALLADGKTPRPFGAEGQCEFYLVESLEIDKGHKRFLIKIRPGQRFLIWTRLQPVCGRVKWQHPFDPK